MSTEPTPEPITPDTEPAAPEPATDAELDPGTEPEPADGQTFDAPYVRKLRTEAAKHRTRAQAAEAELAELRVFRRDRLLAEHAGVLADPADLLTFADPDDLADDEGRPDPDKIAAAARALADDKPHLRRAGRGGPAQGARPGSTAARTAGEVLGEALRGG